jgi:hypothetical protein
MTTKLVAKITQLNNNRPIQDYSGYFNHGHSFHFQGQMNTFYGQKHDLSHPQIILLDGILIA